ncbi:uncharacterized protein BX664DRAFT_331908 [Halteromyces radiatus]|uniref:uncharacterized protein n=1 Tax=Halteromyces radiatus TaxID=101107 RepID=UPI0022204C8B|nr:uncharacterized protein BX664DRAFT_331908 [Halteromyces radiatus]KAI8088985.1 hypothetical protein BX664DRAFT_331908 [Halteromyces radiatus]
MFGLGNRTYEHFNGAAIGMDKQLTQLGATRLGELGAGDDDNSMEDDFIHWQEGFWPLLTEALGTTTTTATTTGQQELAYNVIEKNTEESFVFLGELGDTQQITTYNAKRPYPAPLELYDLTPTSSEQRHCLHLDIDLTGSNMSYTTGDHLGIWPTNNETEVSLIAYLFGWDDMRMDQVISVMPTDPMGKAPFPQPTTLRAALRHYLDIAQIPSRSTLELLIPYCTDDKVKSFFQNLIDNKDEYRTVVVDGVYNLGQLVSLASENTQGVLKNVPLPVVLECYSRLQPRYYSISSSSSESATTVSATAVTLQYHPTPERTVYGVNTNYLWALHQVVVNNTSPMPKYIVDGPRQQYLDEQDGKMKAKIPVHIRQSNFRLPSLSNTPVIMVGPGTGVAPFRGFVRERVYQKQVKGEQVGTTILFFGCRRSDEDYLYRDEWPELFGALGGSSRMITAFSREPNQKKVYVQHRLAEHGEEMWNLLNQGAYFYVCGDAKYMAKDVQQAVIDMSKQFGGYSDEKGVSFVQQLRKSGRYVEDVWA